jgi:hypothetical protein
MKFKLAGFCLLIQMMAGCAHSPERIYASESCVSILHYILGAKATWAIEQKKTGTDVPTEGELFGPGLYVEHVPKCPQGGKYKLNAVKDLPECSIPGHTL